MFHEFLNWSNLELMTIKNLCLNFLNFVRNLSKRPDWPVFNNVNIKKPKRKQMFPSARKASVKLILTVGIFVRAKQDFSAQSQLYSENQQISSIS